MKTEWISNMDFILKLTEDNLNEDRIEFRLEYHNEAIRRELKG